MAIAAASALFGLSTIESQAASSATMVFTVDAGVVTHISITEPFGFLSRTSGEFRSAGLVLEDLYVGNTAEEFVEGSGSNPGLFSVSGSGVSFDGPMAVKFNMIGSPTDGDLAIVFSFTPDRLTLTSENFVEISGGFAVDPSAELSVPTAGWYSATLFEVNEGLGDPLTNTLSVNVIVNSVPEPGSSLLSLLGVSTLFLRRRR
ncbi:PEP-CTERM sorting domain-containing protein [Luteolibacter sp. SL250]|uniref:PEP-CTERM sorting domain-containing protein n=1 Tax=Luteolibacter sp. SL250 TaxID=2995170 RepID=UPI00226F9C47|nr:PEP-CTERM sorting domain-containing protein [Luteolibacter sp. SL250]WAC17790.1 PEP-CTERM sorting domain-containing protein [Luteolibacter sp. SL250]